VTSSVCDVGFGSVVVKLIPNMRAACNNAAKKPVKVKRSALVTKAELLMGDLTVVLVKVTLV
jgi:hypothetical protein